MFGEPTNEDRAAWAEEAVEAFQAACATDDEDAIADLICNLLHLCIDRDESPVDAIRRGVSNFMAETFDPPDGMGPDYAGLETALLIARLRKGLSEAVEYAKYHQPESFDDAEHEAEHKAQFERWDALLNGATDEAAPGNAPSMKEVLQEAAQAWAHQFDGPPDEDLTVSGADLVDWFSRWRERAKAALIAAESTPGA